MKIYLKKPKQCAKGKTEKEEDILSEYTLRGEALVVPVVDGVEDGLIVGVRVVDTERDGVGVVVVV